MNRKIKVGVSYEYATLGCIAISEYAIRYCWYEVNITTTCFWPFFVRINVGLFFNVQLIREHVTYMYLAY